MTELQCANCGKVGTERHISTNTPSGKPMCKSWRACYERKTGERPPKRGARWNLTRRTRFWFEGESGPVPDMRSDNQDDGVSGDRRLF